MAAAFHRAGFDAFDVHLSDLQSGAQTLSDFRGAVFPGGFSFGDVLGAGRGVAAEILGDTKLRDMFAAFFQREDAFALGVCNGCQTLSQLGEILPGGGAFAFPRFLPNRSGRFEGRFVLAEVLDSPSLFFADMAGSILPISSAHAEGRADFQTDAPPAPTAARFVDNRGEATTRYPENPNGSPNGACAFCSPDGRITIMMPHPERVFRALQNSWHPPEWGEDAPWLRMFRNARRWTAM
jgi:phosphoribosylformylglycinamidine synthase